VVAHINCCQRIADVVLASQDLSRTPPAAGSFGRIIGLGGHSPGGSVRAELSGGNASEARATMNQDRDLPAKRRRYI
jgi:hypothetical protein